jgi:hypothetical protein
MGSPIRRQETKYHKVSIEGILIIAFTGSGIFRFLLGLESELLYSDFSICIEGSLTGPD